jgi:pimeloyl-ACP methyl ester carboxylesterase
VLSYERHGRGAPLVLLHGTNCTHRVWDPLVGELAARRDVIAVDLPAHGDSPPTAFTPPGFAREVAALLDELGLDAPAVVGHSVGGWTALELAKLGRAGSLVALTPAGLWRKQSPWLTDLGLRVNWGLGRLLGPAAELPLRTSVGRALGLRSVAAHAERVPAATAIALARDARGSRHFPRHHRETRALRFEGGAAIAAGVPVRVVWGDRDHVALAGKSRFGDELPAHAVVETWPDCGHMVMWDCPRQTVAVALAA